MLETIRMLMEQKKIAELNEYLQEKKPVDIASIIEELEGTERIVLIRVLAKGIAAEVFAYLDKDVQEQIIDSIQDVEVKAILDQLFLDDMVDFIEEMPANIVKRVLRNTGSKRRELINQFLKYEEDTAGSIMTIELVDLKEEMTLKQAIEYARQIGLRKETLDTCFIIDASRHLRGILSLRDLILNNENELVANVMETNIIQVKTSDDQEHVAQLFKTYDLLSMPVVDKENRLVGIITIDDIVDIIEQENTEDFHKMAAMAPNEEPYLKTPVLTLAKKRMTWLLVLMFTAMVTGGIIQEYEEVLESVVLLAAFIPLLMDTGGNSGSQSSAMVIRGLALGEVSTKDYLKIMFKEFRVSLIVASALTTINFIRMSFMADADFLILTTVSITLFSTIIIANITGGLLPLLAKKVKADPAVMAGPLITSIVDALALIIYFTLASALLGL